MNKNKIIIAVSICLILVLSVIVFFVFFGDSEDTKTPNTPVIDNVLDIDKPSITDTPIKDGIVDEEIANEPIINWERDFSEQEFNYEQEINATEKEEFIPAEFPTEGFWDSPFVVTAEYVTLFNYDWDNEFIKSPASDRRMMHKLTLPMFFEEDPNEKKEEVLYVVNSFLETYPNVLFEKYTDVKNIIDIPDEGIYILSETEDAFLSLRIKKPINTEKAFFIYFTATSKLNQLCKGFNSWATAEISQIQEILALKNREYELDVVLKVGIEYLPEWSGSDVDLNTADYEDLTPEQKNLMIQFGVYNP